MPVLDGTIRELDPGSDLIAIRRGAQQGRSSKLCAQAARQGQFRQVGRPFLVNLLMIFLGVIDFLENGANFSRRVSQWYHLI